MTRAPALKAESSTPRVVGVVASMADLAAASRAKPAPDMFELRLDHFARALSALEQNARTLRAPLLITARHPREGGANNLPAAARRHFLTRFLPIARYVDLELRSVRYAGEIIAAARAANVGIVISFHDLAGTPSRTTLLRKLEAARAVGDLFKVATRVDSKGDLAELLAFFDRAAAEFPTAAMGMGRLGRASRIELAGRGSALNYGYLTTQGVRGQLSVMELRAVLRGAR